SSDPAPLYVLIIGDHNGNYSIPAFASTASTPSSAHVTDLYFATYDGSSDNIPDLYYGRISANTTTELQNALDKIIPYERYDIPDGSYLNNCMLIAGVDGTYAKSHGDGTLSYGTSEYFNLAHGFSNIYAYYHTLTSGLYNVMSSTNSGASASVKSKITSGVGFANYTAHCDYYGWGDPAVYNQHIADFNNINKYPFMVGNCCLSFEFDHATDAFGEQVLYAKDEGAIGYIGGSNSSYWNEDVYWAIGLTSISITQANVTNHNYSNTGLGAYDGAWHENGEAYSDWYYSGSQIVQKGNLAVQASSTSFKKYYWEIYHLSGDPSLIPYMTEPSALNLSFTDPMIGNSSLTVTTEPYTYVALSKNNVLLDAQWSGSGTSVTLTPPTNFSGETYCVVGTKQDRSPYINESVNPIASNPPVANFSGTPTTILEGESVAFTDASQYAAEWAWTFGDGGTSTEQNPVHTYTTAGTYTVSLTVTNPLNSDTETKINYITVNINTNPPTTDFVADNTNVSVGATVNFTDLTTNNPETWSWTFEGGIPATSTDQNPSVVYNTPGTYDVSLTSTNNNGSVEETKSGYIIVTAPAPCTAGSTTQEYMYISNFTCNTINNDSGDSGYTDFTSISTDLYIGQEYSFTVTNGNTYSYDQCLIWVDWNCDGDFEDTGEQIYASAIGSSASYTGTFTVPATAIPSSVYVRIRIHYNRTGYTPNTTPCGNSGFGEVEDYMFNLIVPTVPPTANFTSDVTSTCTGIVQFTDASILADTWEWSFGDGNTSTEQNPLHTYTANGTYTVSLYVENAYGNDTYSTTDMITVDMPVAPTTTGAEACGPATLTLNAAGSGTLNWYDAATSGNLVTTGTEYTNTFENTTTLYVQSDIDNPITSNVGPSDNSIGNGGYFGNVSYIHGLIFDAYQDFTLVSVWTDASGTKDRVINLKDASDNIIATKTVNIPDGQSRITLNIDVPAGNNYTLECDGNAQLYRNSTGGSYPYTLTDILSIHYNTADDDAYYYYFYDWEVVTYDYCNSARTPVTATIHDLPTINLGTDTEQCGGTVTLDAGAGFSSYTWNGAAGLQTHNVSTTNTYTVVVEDANGCTATDNINVTIHDIPSVDLGTNVEQCGGPVTLDAGAGFSSYTWNGVAGSQTHDVSTTDTYTVVVEDANACTATDNVLVTINDIPAPVTVSGGGTQCGSSLTLTADNGGEGTIYWQNTTSDGTSTTTASTSQTVSASGTYYFRAQSAEGCWSNEGSATVEIFPSFTASATSTDETGTGNSDGSVTVNVNGGTAPFIGNWSNGSTTNTSNTDMTISGLIGGFYSVTVTDYNGCTAIASATVNTSDAPPVANFEADVTTGCDNLTVNFTDLTNNAPTSWLWTFGDGESSTEQNPEHTYAYPGTYTVTLEATNIVDTDTETKTAYIIVGETPSITLGMIQETILGNDGTATVSNISGGLLPYTYIWSNSETTSVITGLSANEYCVTVTEANACSISSCINVTQEALPEPIADFEADITQGCGSLLVSFTDLSTYPQTWAWDFGDGSTSNIQNPTHTYAAAGTYTVSLTVSNTSGNDTRIMADYISIGVTPMLVISMTSETSAENDGTATVTAYNGAAPYQYNWSNGADTQTTTGLSADNYCVTVTEDNGCTASSCVDVTYNAGVITPVADFEADATEACGTLTVNFTDLSINNPTTWNWNFGDGQTSNEQNPTHTYSDVGYYSVTLNVSNAEGNDYETKIDYIVVHSNPSVTVDVTPASGETIADGGASLTITGGTAPYTTTWSNDETGTEITGLIPGNYSVVVLDDNGCFTTTPFTVNWVSTIKDNSLVYSIYPNPARDEVFVKFDGQIANSIQVFDLLGKVVYNTQPTTDFSKIDISKLQNGVYFVKVMFNDKEFTHKLIVN
ncbi:MAG: PKD domain-containing protein, partial [Bacteroidales bacterium]|nr:PKD domain-containing protein [Bacteroidales bacterium]